MNLPITSRIKRSPLLQTENEIATGSKTTKGKDKEVQVTETKKKDYVGAANDACSAEYIAKNGRAKCDEYEALPQSVKDDANTETSTTTKIEPGEDKVVDVDLKRKQYQDVMEGPWEQRRILRQGRMVGRQKNRYKRKLEKYGTFDKDGKFTQKDGLSQKQQRKSMQFQEGLNRTESARQRTDEGIASGKRPGSRIKRKEDRGATTGEFTDKEQIEMGARRQELAEQAGITTSQAANAVNVEAPNPFSQALESAKELGELDYKVGQYSSGINMKPSAFKMKAKSPATKSLKGNQSKLPQQLQDSIKAAPGKMKSGFKMKGYGKK